jgi:hypothetical protein
MKPNKLVVLIAVIIAGSVSLWSQVSPDLEQGMKPYGSYNGGNLDHTSLSNGNLFFQAPLLSYPQRGEFSYPIVLQYNNENFTIFDAACPPPGKPATYQHNVVFGPPWVHQKHQFG